MQLDKEHIEQLTRLEMAGNINPEEQKVLEDAITTNLEARRIYYSMTTGLSSERLEEISEEMTKDFQVRFAASLRKQKIIKRIKVISIATSSVAAAVLFAVFIMPAIKQDSTIADGLVQNKKDIELKIGSSPAINLSKRQGKIQVGNVVLNNNNRQLTLLNNPSHAAGIATLTVPNGTEYMLQLPDGSTVQLNAATTLKFPLAFTGNTREITISGEAYVSVKKDAAHSFLVNLPHGKVQVLGTEFNINTYNEDRDKIALVSGSIKVMSVRDSSLVKPGYEAILTAGSSLQVDEFDSYDVLSWRKGEYPFTNESLRTVAKLIERFYGVPVKLEGHYTSQVFTGVISRKTPINNFLTGLKLTGFIKEYSFDKEGVLHFK